MERKKNICNLFIEMRIVYMCVNEVLWVAPFSSTHHTCIDRKNKKKKEQIKMTHIRKMESDKKIKKL